MEFINLSNIWYYKDVNELPNWVHTKNLVYYCKNLITGKGYVGETKSTLLNRWASETRLGHLGAYSMGADNIIYRAIRKHGPENFEITILDSGFDSDYLRKESEKYWIKELHTYKSENGYNMTHGGEDASQMHEANRNRYNGDAAGSCHTPEAYDKQRANHGGVLACNTPEAIRKSRESDRRNHGGVLAWNLPSSLAKALETRSLNRKEWIKDPKNLEDEHEAYLERDRRYKEAHGGLLAIHTAEARKKGLEIQRLNHEGVLACHTNIAKLHAINSRIINGINEKLNNLRNLGVPLNSEYYLKPEGPDSTWSYKQHIKYVLPHLDDLRKDERWTEVHENIFSRYYLDDKLKIQIKSPDQ